LKRDGWKWPSPVIPKMINDPVERGGVVP